MRKKFTKEIPFTAFKVSRMIMIEGKPVVDELGKEILVGDYTPEKAKKEMIKKYKNDTIMLYNFENKVETFEMSIDTFLEYATLKEDDK